MATGFIIMQIGNPDLDDVCNAFVQALGACGLEPKRVDKHNQGRLLKSEIVRFIEDAEIIIADLTNERPNCYLEVGYAMGMGKFSNLILTAREDHLPDHPTHTAGGPKIHFDLAGYDILLWHPGRLAEFRSELEKRISRRLAVKSETGTAPTDGEEQLKEDRVRAIGGLLSMKFQAYMEIRFGLLKPTITKTPQELLDISRSAQVHAFGWPIGIVVDKDDARPKPTARGIVAEVRNDGKSWVPPSYDYWSLSRHGAFYQAHSWFEDQKGADSVFFDTRIVRTTEALLYCRRVYERFDADPQSWVRMSIKHFGFKGRPLRSADPNRLPPIVVPIATENEAEEAQTFTLAQIESELVNLVKGFLAPFFELFDFTKFDDRVYGSIIDDFVRRAATRR
jgi:hypothetical protein